jgi:hypothetical protein
VSQCSIELWQLQRTSEETKKTTIRKNTEMIDAETLDKPWPFESARILTQKVDKYIDNLRRNTIRNQGPSDLVEIG